MAGTLRNELRVGPGERRQVMFEQIHYFCRPDHIITLHPFTVTTVNCTPALSNVGGRPCVSLAGGGAATDGANFCYGAAASIRTIAGKSTRIHFGVRSADALNHSWMFGLNVVSTTLTANLDSGGTPSTDFCVIHKTLNSRIPRFRSRKASGTAQSVATTLTCEDATWYDFDLVVTPDLTTAGKGRVQVYAAAAGATMKGYYEATLSTGIPDTVSMALGFGFLEGDTGTDATVVSHIGISQEY
jgi:hypothetical protein